MRVLEIFPDFSPILIPKDPGAIAEQISNGDKAVILTEKMPGKYDTKGFRPKFNFLKKPFFLSACKYVWKYSKDFDVLVTFHTRPSNAFYNTIFKWRNTNGLTYLKADMDNRLLDIGKFGLIHIIRRIKFLWNIRFVDVMSQEQTRVLNLLRKRHPKFEKKLIHVPNGYASTYPVPKAKKKDIIFVVGGVGSSQKGTDILLEILPKIDLKNYKIVFAGKVLDYFKPILKMFFYEHPELKKKLVFKGHVSDRKEMLKLFAEARIFFMPSRYETFSLAMAEAAYCGATIVSTPVGGGPELTMKGKYGAVVEFGDKIGLIRELQKRIDKPELCESEGKQIQKNCKENYMMDVIGKNLRKELKRRIFLKNR